MNRYSELTPSQFNPLSLEEIMMVPMYKRGQNDKLDADIELLDKTFQVDPLDVHKDEAMKLKQDFEAKLDAQSRDLAKNGFNQESRSKFLATKREYENLLGPTGRVGQINNAKKVYMKNFEDYMKDATEGVNKGFSREDALRNWNTEHLSKYTGYDKDKNIIDIGNYGSPKKYSLQEDLKTAKYLLGEDTKVMMRNNHFSYDIDAKGNLIVVDGRGRLVNTNNYRQIKEASQYFQSKWLSNEGEGTKSARFEGIDPKTIVKEINHGLGMMTVDKDDDNREFDYNVQKPSGDEYVPGGGNIISNDSTLTSDALEVNNYNNAIDKINTFSKSNPADKAKAEDLKELKKITDAKLTKDPNYTKFYYREKNIANKIDAEGKAKNLPREKGESDDDYFKRLNLTLGPTSNVDKLRGKYLEYKRAKEEIQNKYWTDSSSTRHNYSYLPQTPKEDGVWRQHNENVYNVLRGASNLGNMLDLTSIYTTGGTKKNIIPGDVKNIHELIKAANPGSFVINNIKTYGDNKTPEITVTFNTLKDTKEYDLEDETTYNDEYGGGEKPVTITFRLKRFSNAADTGSAPGYKNLTGEIANFWKDKGGINKVTGNFQGSEVYSSLIENAYADVSTAELQKRAVVDEDANEALMIRIAKHQAKSQKK